MKYTFPPLKNVSNSMSASEFCWCIFLSVPVGIGASLAIMKSTGGNPTETLVFIPGVVVSLFIFSVLFIGLLNPSE
jgi:ABC-type sugar transport system permease subunit